MKKTMKRTICILAAFAMSIGLLSGCSSKDEESGKVTIAFCFEQLSQPNNVMELAGIKYGFSEIDPNGEKYELVQYDASSDPATQLAQCEDAIEQGAKVVIAHSNDYEIGGEMARICHEAGVAYFMIGATSANADLATCLMSHDGEPEGEIVAQFALDNYLQAGGDVMFINGQAGHTGGEGRKKGFHNILDNVSGVTVLAEEYTDWTRDQGMETMENWIMAYDMENVKAVLCGCDEIAIGACMALEAAGYTDIPCLGMDGTDLMFEEMQNGRPLATLANVYTCFTDVANMVESYLNGEKIAHDCAVEVSMVYDVAGIKELQADNNMLLEAVN